MKEQQQPVDNKRKRENLDQGERDDASEDLDSAEDVESKDGEEEEGCMNDLINLLFVEPGNDDWHVCRPEFTHQLFEEEKDGFLENPEEVAINVNINCMDLSHIVGVSPCANPEEREGLWAKLERGIPADAKRHNVNNVDETLDEQYQDFLEAFGDRHKQSPRGNVDGIYCEEVDESTGTKTGRLVGPGRLLETFTVGTGPDGGGGGGGQYELYLASNKDQGNSTLLLRRAEAISKWYIETADGVDFAGDSRWEILWLFKRHSPCLLSVCGYYTLFTFRNPLAGCKMRVCQCLVMPHLQGLGLGRRLLLAAYRLAATREEVSEVTVEDPAPGFQRLRDACDLEWWHLHCSSSSSSSSSSNISEEGIGRVAKALKVIPAQVRALYEAQLLATLEPAATAAAGSSSSGSSSSGSNSKTDKADKASSSSSSSSAAGNESSKGRNTGNTTNGSGSGSGAAADAEWKAFRLKIKRRILKDDPELGALPKAQMQRELEQEYQVQLERLRRLNSKKGSMLLAQNAQQQ